MERKWVRPAVPDRRGPRAGSSGRPYFRSSIGSKMGQLRVRTIPTLWADQIAALAPQSPVRPVHVRQFFGTAQQDTEQTGELRARQGLTAVSEQSLGRIV